MGAILDRFEAIILDLWGCLHDGVRVHEPARECLIRLRRSERRIIIMSNAPRRQEAVAARIAEMGLTPDLYDRLVASGEETWLAIQAGAIAGTAGRAAVLPIMSERDASLLEGLDLSRTDDPAKAEFLLAIGVEGPNSTIEEVEPVLLAGVARFLPMVCANPDLMVHRGGVAELCAGAIAARYEELGGRVLWFGKPHPGIYRRALGGLGVRATRVLCVGDSLRTDIAGGTGIGAATLFIGGGIHHTEAMDGESLALDRLEALCRRMNVMPDFAMPYLAW